MTEKQEKYLYLLTYLTSLKDPLWNRENGLARSLSKKGASLLIETIKEGKASDEKILDWLKNKGLDRKMDTSNRL